MYVLTAIRERILGWAGHVARMDHKEICPKTLRSLGLQWCLLVLIVLKSELNGTHELFTPETLCRQVLHKGKEMTDGQKLLATEQMDCS